MNQMTRVSVVRSYVDAVVAATRALDDLIATRTSIALESQTEAQLTEVILRQCRAVLALTDNAIPRALDDARALARAALVTWERTDGGGLVTDSDWSKIAAMVCIFLANRREQVWTRSKQAYLSEAWRRGDTTPTIARHLGFSKNAVIGQAHRMGLPGRPSPIRRKA